MTLLVPLDRRVPFLHWVVTIIALLVAISAVIVRYRLVAVEARMAAIEARAAADKDASMAWGAVAHDALHLGLYNEGRCSWTFTPANDRDGIKDAVLIGCSRREPCGVAWTLEDED